MLQLTLALTVFGQCSLPSSTVRVFYKGETGLNQIRKVTIMYRRVIKTCTWQVLGIMWFMAYALVTGGDLWYTFGLALASIPAGSVMFYCHEWIWEKIK